jgi:hypothetical protein
VVMIVGHEIESRRMRVRVSFRKRIENDPVLESYPSSQNDPKTIPANPPAPTCLAKCLALGLGCWFWVLG